MTPSPMLKAIDLVRVNVDAMLPGDLLDHAQQVQDTIAALNDWLNSPEPRSAASRASVVRQLKRLLLHMSHVRDLIATHAAAAALVGAAQAAGSTRLAQGATPFGL